MGMSIVLFNFWIFRTFDLRLNQLKLAPQWHQLPKDLQLFVEVAVNSQSEGLTSEQFNRWVNVNNDTSSQKTSNINNELSRSASSTSKPYDPNSTIKTYINERPNPLISTASGVTTVKPVEPPKATPVAKTKGNPFRQEVDALRELLGCQIYSLFKDISKTTGAPLGSVTGAYYKKEAKNPKTALANLAKYKESLGIKDRNKEKTIRATAKKLNNQKVVIETDPHDQPHQDAFYYLVVQKGDFKFPQYYQSLNLETEKAIWTENPDKARYFTYEEVLKATQSLTQDGYQVAVLHVEKA